MTELPAGIDVETLPGPTRGGWPALYFRDETVLSPSGGHFALAYSIAEASFSNEVGCVAWGEVVDGAAKLQGASADIHVTCWFSPFTVWIEEQTFVFKAQAYDGATLHMPLVVIDISRGFAILPQSNNHWSRPGDVTSPPRVYLPLSPAELREGIVRAL